MEYTNYSSKKKTMEAEELRGDYHQILNPSLKWNACPLPIVNEMLKVAFHKIVCPGTLTYAKVLTITTSKCL